MKKILFVGREIDSTYSAFLTSILRKSHIEAEVHLETRTAGSVRELGFTNDPSDYDIVIIANDRGNGAERAALLPKAVRSRTIIVWTRYTEQTTMAYEIMGIGRFCYREHAHEAIVEMLNQTPEQ